MRIRKNGSVPRQMPSYKYCVSTGWLMQSHEPSGRPSSGYNSKNRLVVAQSQERQGCKDRNNAVQGLVVECSCDRKQQQQQQLESTSSELECKARGIEVGEEPRTPPPCYGDKLSIPRLREQEQQHVEAHEEVRYSDKHFVQCSCGKGKRTTRAPEFVKGESSSRRKRVRVPGHTLPSRVERDTAEPSSHDNCGPEQQRFDNTEAIRAKYQQEISKIDDPLLRAMHTVVSEAGIEGLTARETAEKIISKGLLSEADIPRSVKMAKAMRDSPYLMEINKSSSKFVLWSTFLEESSKSKAQGLQAAGACKRRRRSGLVITSGDEKVKEEEQQPGGEEEMKTDDHQAVVVAPLPSQPPKRFLLDLNVVPEDVDEQVYS